MEKKKRKLKARLLKQIKKKRKRYTLFLFIYYYYCFHVSPAEQRKSAQRQIFYSREFLFLSHLFSCGLVAQLTDPSQEENKCQSEQIKPAIDIHKHATRVHGALELASNYC